MKKVIVTIGCLFGVLALGISMAAQAGNSQQAVIDSLQSQIKAQSVATNQSLTKLRAQMQQQISALQAQVQQVQASIPKQIKDQSAVTNQSITKFQKQVQKQITQLRSQVQQVQSNLSTEIQHLQQQIVSVSQMR